jgi:pimeloyl-ACP methyl ester carboxylesterase
MSDKKSLILLIPGNPSVPGIYDPFLNQVVKELDLKNEVIAKVLPHLGQCNEKRIKMKSVRVQDVVSDHKKTIQNLIKKHKPEQTILIGHSLGSAVTISLYQDLSPIVDSFIILCPFLGPHKNNERYLKMFRNPLTRLGMIGITHTGLAHPLVSRKIFKRWLGENPFNEHIPREIKKPFYLRHFFSLVSNYFSDFKDLDIPARVAKMDPEKSFFVFAANDYWVPDESIYLLPKKSKYIKSSEISHDFCLKEDQYKKVAQIVSGHLRGDT